MFNDIENLTIQRIMAAVDLEGRNILEIGCGDGRLTAQYASLPRQIIAVDPNERSIELARKRYPGIDFRIGSGESLDMEDGCMDVVLFTLSLHHHDDPARALEEAARVIKPQGSILVVEPVPHTEVDNVCNPFNDERAELALVQEIIHTPGWTILHEERFAPTWIFNDLKALHRHLFSYYDTDWNEELIAQVNAHIPDKLKDAPLYLDDTLCLALILPGT